ncbi:sulfotransferase family 2 domain-containing protein [Bacillus carboniphilus]|uniref:Sulfotransferase family 2 domain-containing protein n=1 Tax=Bacillus carboniphilus TaxID=86663 RepID=A0ABY9JU74_9BACI|nr:sulfotransferase family 2 domain-containing protein [Bacillus carboniphilus]WLR42966.1 sulfotransferase family 2 domain-containing protein [Bacillus carboniphilus]
MLFHLHIPKTGGTSLKHIVKQNYQNIAEVYRPPIKKTLTKISNHNYDCVIGHMRYGAHEYFKPNKYHYITLLRNPIDRVISEYYFIARRPQHENYHLYKHLSLEEYASLPILQNMQSQFLLGYHAHQNLTIADLKIIKERINSGEITAGITEEFEKSLTLFSTKFNWKVKMNVVLNKNNMRPINSTIPPVQIATIKRHNLIDLELYSYVKKYLKKE